MKQVFSLLLMALICVCESQNLINNCSFENRFSDPDGHAQTDLIKDWYNCQKNRSCDNPCDDYIHLHSPDYFLFGYNTYYFREINILTNIQMHIPAASGNCYVGMNHAELLGTELDHQIEKNVIHNFSFSFWIAASASMGDSYYGNYNINSPAKLNVYCSKNKIKYTDNNKDHRCTDSRYDDFNISSNNYKLILQVSLGANTFSPQQWHQVSANFEVTENGYNWIVVELDVDDNTCSHYVLIDNINLVNYCVNGCSGTDGKTAVGIYEYHNSYNPFTISGLSNVKHVDLSITQNFSHVWDISLDNPPSIIAWNGTNGISEVSAGQYEYNLYYETDCGRFNRVGFIGKTNSMSEPTLPNEHFNYLPVSKPPKLCCPYNPDIIIQNQNLVQDQTILISQAYPAPLLYKAVRSIVAGPAVTVLNQPADNTVIFEAGEFIDLLPGFETQLGSDFTAQIAPCSTQDPIIILDSKSIAVDSDGKESGYYSDEDTLANNNAFSVSPNPFESEFVFSIVSSESVTIKNIEIVTATGQTVFMVSDVNQSAFVVNAEEWPNGIYFTRALLSNGELLCTKIIKSKQ